MAFESNNIQTYFVRCDTCGQHFQTMMDFSAHRIKEHTPNSPGFVYLNTKATGSTTFVAEPPKKGPMTKVEYFEFHKQCTEKMTAITKVKNSDYTGTGDDPFANFSRVEALGICTTEQGFLTRMVDKLSRINSFAQKGELQVKDESVSDTLLDLANYCLLFAGYLKSKSTKE